MFEQLDFISESHRNAALNRLLDLLIERVDQFGIESDQFLPGIEVDFGYGRCGPGWGNEKTPYPEKQSEDSEGFREIIHEGFCKKCFVPIKRKNKRLSRNSIHTTYNIHIIVDFTLVVNTHFY
jgi:hypothetical protein